jgi:hypothetical protein
LRHLTRSADRHKYALQSGVELLTDNGQTEAPPAPTAAEPSNEQSPDSEDQTPPAWIPKLCAAIAEALEDERLSSNTYNAIGGLLTDLDNSYCSDFPTLAKTTLPVSLYRACGFEPPAPKRPVSASRQLSRLLADESLPEEIRDAIFDAVENIMNDLNRGKEMTLAWVKLYLDEAIKRREEKSAEE